MANEIINTILEQINARALKFSGYRFVKLSDNALRINKGKKNFDIEYNEGLDLYNIAEHCMKKDFSVESKEIKEIYFDQLQEMIGEFFNFPLAEMPSKIILKEV